MSLDRPRPHWKGVVALVLFFAAPAIAESSAEIEFGGGLWDPDERVVIARRGSVALYVSELEAASARVPENQRQGFLEDSQRFTQFLNSALLTKRIASEAAELINDPETAAQLRWALIEELAEIARDKIIDDKRLDDYTDAAREEYLRSPSEYRAAPRVTFSHVLFSKDRGSMNLLHRRAHAIREQYKDGADFSELAIEHSDDPSVHENHGRLEDIAIDQLDSSFRNGIREASLDEVHIVESQYGVHVVVVHERKPGEQLEFDEVKEELVRAARQEHAQRILQQFVRDFRANELELPEGAVRGFLERYGVSWD